MSYWVELIEAGHSAKQSEAIEVLGLLISGQVEIEGQKGQEKAAKEFASIGGIQALCLCFHQKLQELNEIDRNECEGHLRLELELRLILNSIFATVMHNLDDEVVIREFLDQSSFIEDNCFKAVKMSLDLAIVPIRKIIIIFYLYLQLLFGPVQGTINSLMCS